jgi:hypothetical protein
MDVADPLPEPVNEFEDPPLDDQQQCNDSTLQSPEGDQIMEEEMSSSDIEIIQEMVNSSSTEASSPARKRSLSPKIKELDEVNLKKRIRNRYEHESLAFKTGEFSDLVEHLYLNISSPEYDFDSNSSCDSSSVFDDQLGGDLPKKSVRNVTVLDRLIVPVSNLFEINVPSFKCILVPAKKLASVGSEVNDESTQNCSAPQSDRKDVKGDNVENESNEPVVGETWKQEYLQTSSEDEPETEQENLNKNNLSASKIAHDLCLSSDESIQMQIEHFRVPDKAAVTDNCSDSATSDSESDSTIDTTTDHKSDLDQITDKPNVNEVTKVTTALSTEQTDKASAEVLKNGSVRQMEVCAEDQHDSKDESNDESSDSDTYKETTSEIDKNGFDCFSLSSDDIDDIDDDTDTSWPEIIDDDNDDGETGFAKLEALNLKRKERLIQLKTIKAKPINKEVSYRLSLT